MKQYLIFLTILLAGCMTSMSDKINAVHGQYETIAFDDGISLEEAKVIAQRALIKQNMVKIYDLEKPKVFRDVTELPDYQQYWFIAFNEIKNANIQFIFMAIINKETGKVKFADDYKEGKEWVLEAALLSD